MYYLLNQNHLLKHYFHPCNITICLNKNISIEVLNLLYILTHKHSFFKLKQSESSNLNIDLEENYLLNSNIKRKDLNIQKFKEEIWTALLLKCQKKLYDQESLKNYVTLKKEKYENQKQKHEKYLKNRLERLKKSFALTQLNNNSNNSPFDSLGNYTSSIQKAMKESILWEKNSRASSSFQTVEKFFVKKHMLQKVTKAIGFSRFKNTSRMTKNLRCDSGR